MTKFSAYTKAGKCTDLADVLVGIQELKDYFSDCESSGKKPSQAAYNKFSALIKKRQNIAGEG